MIISDKHGIYELPHEFPNKLRLRALGKIRKIAKTLWNYNLLAITPKIKMLSMLEKNC